MVGFEVGELPLFPEDMVVFMDGNGRSGREVGNAGPVRLGAMRCAPFDASGEDTAGLAEGLKGLGVRVRVARRVRVI